jgi:hypothetical protein
MMGSNTLALLNGGKRIERALMAKKKKFCTSMGVSVFCHLDSVAVSSNPSSSTCPTVLCPCPWFPKMCSRSASPQSLHSAFSR